MKQAMQEPWGKLDRSHPDPATAPRLSLVAHCIDVAAVTRALLGLPTWRKRFDRLAGRPLQALDIDRLTVLAFWHDVGKAGAGFYAKALPESVRQDWQRRTNADSMQSGHTRTVAPLSGDDRLYTAHRDALGTDIFWQWAGDDPETHDGLLELWLAAVSHHGEPLTLDELRGASGVFTTWLIEIDGYVPLDGLRRLGSVARELWPAAFKDPTPSPVPTSALVHAFAGLVSLADWIGSNADKEGLYFPYDLGPDDENRWPIAEARARDVLRRMRIDVEDIRSDLQRRSPRFEDVFPFYANDMQRNTAERTRSSPTVLEAETGSGKTEAALWRFKTLFEAGEVDALCFLLPTRVAATSLNQRVETFLKALFPEQGLRLNSVLAVPGYLRANGADGRCLAPFSVLWPDAPDDTSIYWAAENSKRYFAAAAATGTVDQFLLTALRTRHAHLRATVSLRALVVVDEVHASDRYMRTLLRMALKRHVAAGGHALLLSATLTADMRDGELLRPSSRRGAASPEVVLEPAATARVEAQCDYPRISSPGQAPWIGSSGADKTIHHSIMPWMREPDKVAALAVEAALAGARVLVLRNTVRQAVATQRAIEAQLGIDHPALFRCRQVPAPHHGRYALPDRRLLDLEVGERFGKTAARATTPCILCATQTVEISVDCDADFMITDLAPMDVLLQRLGRLHRHRERNAHRSGDHRTARCVILVPPDRDLSLLMQSGKSRGLGLGARSAYPDLLCVEATLSALEDQERFPTLQIPSHNRALVERACGSLAALAERLGEPWKAHHMALQGMFGAQGVQAAFASVDWDKPWAEAGRGELDIEARTRLGLDGMELMLPEAWDSPFGAQVDRLTIPAWMLPPRKDDAPEMPAIDDLREDQEGLTFKVRGRDFTYDRLGLRVVKAAATP